MLVFYKNVLQKGVPFSSSGAEESAVCKARRTIMLLRNILTEIDKKEDSKNVYQNNNGSATWIQNNESRAFRRRRCIVISLYDIVNLVK